MAGEQQAGQIGEESGRQQLQVTPLVTLLCALTCESGQRRPILPSTHGGRGTSSMRAHTLKCGLPCGFRSWHPIELLCDVGLVLEDVVPFSGAAPALAGRTAHRGDP